MINADDVFSELFNLTKEYVPEADHLELCTKMLVCLSQHGFNIELLHGEDDIIDEAIEEVLESYEEYDVEEDY